MASTACNYVLLPTAMLKNPCRTWRWSRSTFRLAILYCLSQRFPPYINVYRHLAGLQLYKERSPSLADYLIIPCCSVVPARFLEKGLVILLPKSEFPDVIPPTAAFMYPSLASAGSRPLPRACSLAIFLLCCGQRSGDDHFRRVVAAIAGPAKRFITR